MQNSAYIRTGFRQGVDCLFWAVDTDC